VVYNHLGPEGNYLGDFGPYFTMRHKTAWGRALNFDGEESEEVRRFFIENARYWQTEFHLDALRLDAVHAILDFSAVPFLEVLARATHRQEARLNRRFYLIAESDLNDARYIIPEAAGGYGLDAQWCDDLHHCLHVLLTGEREGYYSDFIDATRLLGKVLREGYAYTGQYSPFRKRRHGNSPRLASAKQFVVCSQNHDQIGNRREGERLTRLVGFEALKLASGSVLLSPFLPLLFMGEEYGETASFQYFISHTDAALVEAVRQGRRAEFAGFAWKGEAPDPQSEATFRQCILKREARLAEPRNRVLREFYGELIRLRKSLPAIAQADKESIEAQVLEGGQGVVLHYLAAAGAVCVLLNFARTPASVEVELRSGMWNKLLDSADRRWGGEGSAAPLEVRSVPKTRDFAAPNGLEGAARHGNQNGEEGRGGYSWVSLQLSPESLVVFQQA
jgi:maltooligosyltrehalose trehalohydrolase